MKNFNKLLRVSAYIVLAVLSVGVALYFISWPTDLEIYNRAVVNADGESIETLDMELHLRKHNHLFKAPEYQVLVFDHPDDSRYAYGLLGGNPELSHNDMPPYVVVWGFYNDKYLNKDYSSYFAISMEKGLFIAKQLDTEHYLIGSADADYDAKEILEYFSPFIENGCKPW